MSEPGQEPKHLGARLRRATSRQLLELIPAHAGEMTVREVRQVLLNPFVTGPAIDELLAIRRLLSVYEVRSAIARHRRTPQTAALRFVSGLFWRDLVDIAADLRIAPAVRRVAEKYLVRRLGKLAVGERMAIARRATPTVIAHLRHDPSTHVIKALLDNPRLTEEALLPLTSSDKTLPRILELVARHERWGPRYELRVALSRNPQTPCRALVEILPHLRREDLRAVVELDAHSWIVRHRARELTER
jgi:hypothetical protein